jgi:1,4-alpha-glucan branching enzyme
VKKEAIANSNKRSVTFELPSVQAGSVSVVGEFNNWDPAAGAMKQSIDGTWTKAVRLAPGMYRFGYVADGEQWHNDPAADGYEPSEFGQDNCIVVVE